jgi:hypothetical protein
MSVQLEHVGWGTVSALTGCGHTHGTQYAHLQMDGWMDGWRTAQPGRGIEMEGIAGDWHCLRKGIE